MCPFMTTKHAFTQTYAIIDFVSQMWMTLLAVDVVRFHGHVHDVTTLAHEVSSPFDCSSPLGVTCREAFPSSPNWC